MADGSGGSPKGDRVAPAEFALWLWAERLARMDLLRDLVPEGHPVMASEEALVGRSERSLQAFLSDGARDALGRTVLAKAAAYLRAYGVPAEDLGRRLSRVRADVGRALSC